MTSSVLWRHQCYDVISVMTSSVLWRHQGVASYPERFARQPNSARCRVRTRICHLPGAQKTRGSPPSLRARKACGRRTSKGKPAILSPNHTRHQRRLGRGRSLQCRQPGGPLCRVLVPMCSAVTRTWCKSRCQRLRARGENQGVSGSGQHIGSRKHLTHARS
jgi:hypothetical protein